jgi:hypothetical protein
LLAIVVLSVLPAVLAPSFKDHGAFDHDMRVALDKAAKDDRRPVSQLVIKVMADWLKAKGYLK